MAKYISVLNSDIGKPIWKAVQWAETRQELVGNQFYTAGVNLSLPKHSNDVQDGSKTITETRTGTSADATIIKLAADSTNIIRLAQNKASLTFVKKIQKSLA
jgi:hypothetical protein